MVDEPVRIPVDRLRHVFDGALRHIEASAGRSRTVTLKEDRFWSVAADELPTTSAPSLTAGRP
ncbi:hypothetical protein [Streptomyces sp. NPDC127084]|uniref:hypothetical protein n=1 Tax=Streptomyces sp. NPDC127084 TaxID=3347133 RepID=UPI003658AF09